jgi:hypothetical protein
MANIPCTNFHTPFEPVSYDWEILDAKGRAVGARVYSFTVTRTAVDREPGAMTSICAPEEIGTWFAFRTDALRNGKPFGPGSSWYDHQYKTETERSAAIEKFLKGSKARALKQFAK